MKLIEKKENQMAFTAEIDESLANAIRRQINRIPVLAIDEVEVSKNDSALYDEIIAHRLGLIPIEVSKDKKNPKVTLNVKKEGMIYSKEFVGAQAVYGETPITFLNKGQEIKIKATTKIGRGVEHSKFSPGLMFYRNIAEITLDKELKDDIERNFPENKIKDKGNKIIFLDDKKQEILDVCEGICSKKGKKIEVNFKNELVINLESFGQLNVNEIFKKSIDELKKDLQKVAKVVKK